MRNPSHRNDYLPPLPGNILDRLLPPPPNLLRQTRRFALDDHTGVLGIGVHAGGEGR